MIICKKAAVPLVAILLVVGVEQSGSAQTRQWSGGGDNNNWTTATNWVGGVAPAADDLLVFDTFARLTSNNSFPTATQFNGITFGPAAGAFTLSGDSITLGGNLVDNTSIVTQTISLPLILSVTPEVQVASDAFLTLGGAVSGRFGLTKTGDGTLTLTGANSFTGPMTINDGTLRVAADNNLGGAPSTATAGNIVINGGTLRTTTGFTVNANRGIALGPASGSGTGTIDVVQGGTSFDVTNYTAAVTTTYNGVIANNGSSTSGLTKEGFGRLILGGANTYTGPTAVRVGTLSLDFNPATAPASNIINSGSALTLGGATAGLGSQTFAALIMQGAAGETNSQTFNGTTIANGPTHIVVNSGANGTANLNLGALTHSTGGVVKFVLPAAGNVSTSTTNTNGIIGGWATVGAGLGRPDNPAGAVNRKLASTTFATVENGNIRGLRDNEYTTATTGVNLDTYVTAATNLNINNSSTDSIRVDDDAAGTVTDINTLRFSEVTARSIRIGAGNTLRLGKSGAIFRSDFAGTPTWAIGSSDGGAAGTQDEGTLTAGGPGAGDGEIVFIMNSPDESAGSLNVEVVVADNPAGGKVSVVKMGAGSMKFRGHNTYSGDTYILEGRFQLAGTEIGDPDDTISGNPGGWGTGTVHIFPGGQAFPSGSGPGLPILNNFKIAGLGTAEEAFAAIRFGGTTTINGNIELIGDSRLGGGGQANEIPNAGVNGAITGPFGLDFGALATINTNLFISNPANDWRGTTTLNARNNDSVNRFRLGNNEVVPHGVGRGNVVMNGNTSNGRIVFDLGGFNETINALMTTPSNPVGAIVTNNNETAATSTLTLGDYDQSGIFAGIMQDGTGVLALTKIGAGVQTLAGANTFSGPVNINNGTLSVTGSITPVFGSTVINVNASATGAGTLSGTGTVGDVTVAANSGANRARLSPGATGALGAVGTLTMNSLTVNGGDLQFDLVTPAASDRINVGGAPGTARFTAATTISPSGGTAGSYTILTATSPITYGVTPTLTPLPNPLTRPTTYALDTASDPNSLKINVTGGAKILTWTGSTNSDWDVNTTANWTDGANAETFFVGDTVTFGDAPANRNIAITGVVTPGAVTVNNSGGNTYTFTGPGAIAGSTGLLKSGTGTLILANANTYVGPTNITGGTLQVGNGGTSGSLGAGDVTNESILAFNRSDASTASNVISGSGELRHIGTGALTLAGASTYTGPTNITSGTVVVTNAGGGTSSLGALPSEFVVPGVVTVSPGAAVDFAGAAGANSIDFGGKQFRITGTGVGGTGALTNSGTTAQQNALEQVVLTGNATVGGTGRFDIRADDSMLDLANFTLTKVGPNQFTLVGTNVTNGNIVVNEGILAIEATAIVPDTGAGHTITYNAGTTAQFFDLQPASLSRLLVFNGGATMGNASGAPSTVNSNITLNGNLTVTNLNNSTGALNVDGIIGETGGARSLIKTGAATLNLNNPANTYSGPTVISGGNINASQINDGGQSSSIGQSSSAAANLVFSGGNLTYTSVFSGVTTNRLFTVGSGTGGLDSSGGTGVPMSFTNTGSVAVSGPGATLLLTGSNTDNNVLAPKLVDGADPLSLRKAGAGTWNLTNSNTYTGTTTVDEGLLRVTGSITGSNAATVATGATLAIEGSATVGGMSGGGTTNVGTGAGAATLTASHIRQGVLDIAAGSSANTTVGGGTSVLGNLMIAGTPNAPTAKFNLNDAAILEYSGASPVATVRQQILAGRGGPGFGASWTGQGITSSAAAAADPESRSIGYAENSSLPLGPYTNFRGQPVDDTSVLMAFTRTGDANLDGLVNDDDVTIVGATYAPGVPQPQWSLGDFDYNGFVDDDDVTLLGVFYDPSATPLAAPANTLATNVAAVPEPATATLLVLASIALVIAAMRRRRAC
ncbi:MAG: autotransporter-associated beta strand repeat-containing protein [Pirellulales bacterium]